MADRSNYLVATIHRCAYNIKREKEKERKEKGKKKKRKGNKPSYINRIVTLLYSTFERVPIIFYHTTLC